MIIVLIELLWILLVSFVVGISSTPLIPSAYFVLLYAIIGLVVIDLTHYLVIMYNRAYGR